MKKNDDLGQLMFSVKVLRNFTSLPGFPKPLYEVVVALKDFLGATLEESVMNLMQAPNMNEVLKLLEHPEVREQFGSESVI